MMIPAMMKEATNSSTAPAMLATISSAFLATSPSCGCMPLTTAGRSVWACDQKAWTFLPTTGHSATLAGGAGTSSVWSRTLATRPWTESPMEVSSTAVGATISTTPASDYQRGRKPLLAAQPAGELLMRRVEGHRQDQRPRHQRQEGREDPVAQRRQDEDQRGSDEDIHQLAAQALLENEIGLVGRCHCSGSSPKRQSRRSARKAQHPSSTLASSGFTIGRSG